MHRLLENHHSSYSCRGHRVKRWKLAEECIVPILGLWYRLYSSGSGSPSVTVEILVIGRWVRARASPIHVTMIEK
jgi:hypothetical protein